MPLLIFDKVTHKVSQAPNAREAALFLWGLDTRRYDVYASLDNLPSAVNEIEAEVKARLMLLDALAGKPRLNDEDRMILACLIEGWDEGGAKLYGAISYQRVFDLFDRLGVPAGAREWQNEFLRKMTREDSE